MTKKAENKNVANDYNGDDTCLQHKKVSKININGLYEDLIHMEGVTNCLNEAIKVLQEQPQAIKGLASEGNGEYDIDDATTLNKEQCRSSVFDDKRIADFLNYWEEVKNNGKKNYLGFVDYYMPNRFAVDKDYKIEISTVTVVGETVQLMVMLFDIPEDEKDVYSRPAGLLIENYRFGSSEFKKMVKSVFAQVPEGVIAVDLDRICEAVGTISLKMVDDKVALDWESFDPEQTPISDAFDFGIALAEKINKLSV